MTSAVLLSTVALAIAERGKRDPVRWGAPGTATSLASGLALLATTIAAACSDHPLWIGLLPIAAGIALRAAAMRALGDAFTSETVFAPGRPIVRTGLHRWVRHPSDLGLVLYAGGLALLGGSPLAGAFAIAVCATTGLRIAHEERLIRRSCCSGAAPREFR